MATFGMGVAAGKLHEMTDVTLAADWERISIHQFAIQPDGDKQPTELSAADQDTEDQTEVKNEKNNTDLDETNSMDTGHEDKSNIEQGANEEQSLEQDAVKTEISASSIVDDQSKSVCSNSEQKLKCDEAVMNQTQDDTNGETFLELSEDVVSAFEKQVESKMKSTSELQHFLIEKTTGTNFDENRQDENIADSRKPIMATYTRTKSTKETTCRQHEGQHLKDATNLSSKQGSSESETSMKENRRRTVKPDSGERRNKRLQEDTRSGHSLRRKVDKELEEFSTTISNSNEPFYRRNDDYLNDRFQSPRQPYESGAAQTTLLELMTKGLGNFTEQMANVMIEKIRPEYETLSRKVAKDVQESTMFELKELRSKVSDAQKALTDLEKEKEHLKKQLDAEKTKRHKELEEKNTQIKTLEKELDQSKTSLKERDRVLKKAENKAKAEEQKRVKLEEEYQVQCTNLKRLLDRAKGDLLVYRSKKRVALIQEKQDAVALVNRLNSHH